MTQSMFAIAARETLRIKKFSRAPTTKIGLWSPRRYRFWYPSRAEAAPQAVNCPLQARSRQAALASSRFAPRQPPGSGTGPQSRLCRCDRKFAYSRPPAPDHRAGLGGTCARAGDGSARRMDWAGANPSRSVCLRRRWVSLRGWARIPLTAHSLAHPGEGACEEIDFAGLRHSGAVRRAEPGT
jgi:hypothetical protein